MKGLEEIIHKEDAKESSMELAELKEKISKMMKLLEEESEEE
jgi:hypothetical protein